MLQTTNEKKSGVGIIVGRFHVPELSEGHRDLFDSVIARHDSVIVVLGVAPIKATKTNPLDFETRRQMIQETYPNIKVVYINDTKFDWEWVENLDYIIACNIPPAAKVMLYGSRESFLEIYQTNNGKFPWTVLEPDKVVSGTRIRSIVSVQPILSNEARKGAIWATMQKFDNVFMTVDVLPVVRNSFGKIEKVLMCWKNLDHGKLRLIGGFTDPSYNDEGRGDCLEHNAAREVQEEAGIVCDNFKYLGSFFINDWRYRSGNDKINTALFVCDVTEEESKKTKAGDDIDGVVWISAKEFGELNPWESTCKYRYKIMNKVAEGHLPLVSKLINYTKKGENNGLT